MDKLKKIWLIPLILVGVLIFGAWTPVDTVESVRYLDATLSTSGSVETINFTKREIAEENYTPSQTPHYIALSGYSNSCGAVAGGIIVGYYDKYFPELIPGWESFYSSNGFYRLQTEPADELIAELYTLMRTNVDDAGVSESDFKNGLKKYINNHGYNVEYTGLLSNKNLNYENYKKAIDSGKVVALLSLPCNLYNMAHSDTHDEIAAAQLESNHIMVGYGYIKYNYYNASGLFRTDTYLVVATGRNFQTTALYRFDEKDLNAAYVVTIS